MKARAGGPGDEPEDVAAGGWGGYIRSCARPPRWCSTPRPSAPSPADVEGSRGGALAGSIVSPLHDPAHPRPAQSPTRSAAAWSARSPAASRPGAWTIAAWSTGRRPGHGRPALRRAPERDFYPPLREFITSGPVVAMVPRGDEAVRVVRRLNGATDGRSAVPGTIRGDPSLSNRENLVHGSGLPWESAVREMAIWFPDLD